MSDKKVFEYEGKEANVTWDGRLCIHVGECGRSEGELFVGGRKPWCQPDLAQSVEAVVEVVRRCPTGALVVRRADGQPSEEAEPVNRLVVANNGPLYLSGQLEVDGAAEDMEGVKFRAALCRCGQSKNKPFCDNSHEKAGFVDRGAIGQTGAELESQGGPLKVKRIPNGPLIVTGNLTMVAGSGREAWQGTRAALCRCGASKNKPFCDGSHTAAGFEAE